MIEKEKFITVRELAGLLSVHPSLVYKYIRAEKLHKDLYIRFGRKILFRCSKIDEYLFPKQKTLQEQIEEEMNKLRLQYMNMLNEHPPQFPF